MYGVSIEHGPRDWQVFQQQDGRASIALDGHFERRTEGRGGRVFARMVDETTGEDLTLWREAETDGFFRWHIVLADLPAGGLYRIETCLMEEEGTAMEWCTRGDMSHHIGIGDLFVIAGQSNSAGYGKDSVYDPPELGVHLYRNSAEWALATHPMNDSTRTRNSVNMDAANTGHSPYLAFGRFMKRHLGWPIGLIQCALGGSSMAMWDPNLPDGLYANMVARIRAQGSRVRGILWYQGCADTSGGEDTACYLEHFKRLVERLRSDTGDETLPFFTFQVGRYLVKPVSDAEDRAWSVIREAQRQAALTIHGVKVLPTLDGMLSDMIHNGAAYNLVLGERVARQSLNALYRKSFFADAPDLRRAALTEESRIELEFAPVYGYLYCFEMQPEQLPFLVSDRVGPLAIVAYESRTNALILTLGRKPVGEMSVTCCPGQDPKCRCIVDYATHLPLLAFTAVVEGALS